MDRISRSVDSDFTGLDRRGTPHGPFRRFLRDFIHFFSYHLILSRQSIRTTRAAGFRLRVRPTVFHPRFFLSSEYFAKFLDGLDLSPWLISAPGPASWLWRPRAPVRQRFWRSTSIPMRLSRRWRMRRRTALATV